MLPESFFLQPKIDLAQFRSDEIKAQIIGGDAA
jgi:hypothetical protein